MVRASAPLESRRNQREPAMAMDVVDYEINGAEMQFVEVEVGSV